MHVVSLNAWLTLHTTRCCVSQAVGLNPLSCGPVHRSIKEACESLVSRLDMTTSKMVLEEVGPRPTAAANLSPGQQQVLSNVMNSPAVCNHGTGRSSSHHGGATVSQGTQTGSLQPSPSVPVRSSYPGAGGAQEGIAVMTPHKPRSCGHHGCSVSVGGGCVMQQAAGRECRIVIAPAAFCIRLSQSVPGVTSGAVQRPLRMTQSVPVSVSSSSCWACHAHVIPHTQRDCDQATPTHSKSCITRREATHSDSGSAVHAAGRAETETSHDAFAPS